MSSYQPFQPDPQTGETFFNLRASQLVLEPEYVDVLPETILAISGDKKDDLVAKLTGALDTRKASKLLHLCCGLDSAKCASALLGGELGTIPPVNEYNDSGKTPLHTAAYYHALRCAEVLLKQHARTDLRTKDEQGQLPLQLTLNDAKMDLDTNPNDFSIKGLGIHMSLKELLTVKLVGEHTKEVGQVAYGYAFEGRLAPLTALLIVAADKVNDSVVERPDFRSGFKEKATIYEWLIREALDLGVGSKKSERRKLLLREIELLQLFGAVAHSGGGEKRKKKKKKKKVTSSPLIRAAQGGDEAIVQLLLKTNTDVNDADANGDTAVHCTLKLSRFSPQHIRILWLLLEHGALVHQRNKLGLTAFDIAARNGNSEALEVLLLGDLDGKHHITGMKETPLSVKNRSEEFAELLSTWGANSEVPQQWQGAIDLATSQAMRNILLSPSTVNFNSSSNKAEVYKYFDSHRKCVRGAKCFYANCVEESEKVKEGADQSHSFAAKLLKRKVFVGGLPPSVDSDDLGKFCEKFGSVEDAIVIVTQIKNKIQSQGFGFVTFRQETSASEAMKAHYVTMREKTEKTVEIRSLVSKLVLGAEFEKMSPQQEEENVREGDSPEQGSWDDKLVLGQPAACSIEPQVTKSFDDSSTPTWLKVFKKWFPGFLQGLTKNQNYALSSLKTDFLAKFGLELDHLSVGHSKLSNFLKCFSKICTLEKLRICKRGAHMVLRSKFSSPHRRLIHTLTKPQTIYMSALIENVGDCLLNLSSGDAGDLKCLQNNSKCFQDVSVDNIVDSKCLHDLSQLKGTTNVAWVLEDCVLAGCDSRSTIDRELRTDSRVKFTLVTKHVLATRCGSTKAVKEVLSHMSHSSRKKAVREGTHGQHVRSVAWTGRLMPREVNAKHSVFLISGVQSKSPVCYVLVDRPSKTAPPERERALNQVLQYLATGSGSKYAEYILQRRFCEFENRPPPDVAIETLMFALFWAGLHDPCTGGIFTVIYVGEDGIEIKLSKTFLQLYIQYYDVSFRVLALPTDDEHVDQFLHLVRFRQVQSTTIFLFYMPEHMSTQILQQRLGKCDALDYGHPLTALRGGYYMHRMTFEDEKDCTAFFQQAREIRQRDQLPFTSLRDYFRRISIQGKNVLVARQSLEMLQSLVADLNGPFTLQLYRSGR